VEFDQNGNYVKTITEGNLDVPRSIAFKPNKSISSIKTSGNRINQFALYENYPNPFNPRTIINYELPITSEVELSIYNLLGQKIITLISEKQSAGKYEVEFNGQEFPSGVYLYKIQTENWQAVKKMILIK
jgi:hypothetical protein